MVTKLDWSIVNGAIENCKERYGLDNLPKAFSYLVLEKLFPNCDEEIEDLLTDGGNDCGVDAIKIDKYGNDAHVHIFQFKYYKSVEKSSHHFPSKEADKIISFIDRLFDEDADLEKITNTYLWDKIQEIWSVYKQASTKFTVYFCSNGSKLDVNHRTRVSNSLGQYRINFDELDFNSILNFTTAPKTDNTKHQFNAIEKQYLGRVDGDIKGIVATISAKDLINMIKDPLDPDVINSKVFDQNIRVFLGRDNPVNESIIQTALSDNNIYFWYLNNGLTAVCSNLSYREGIRSPAVEIENLQIVNGAQTSCALFEAAKQNESILEDVLLLIRIYETKNPKLPYEIAVATNSQTRILSRDLMSNSSVQVKLEEAFKNLGYFYERKKNQHQDKDTDKRIDALKLGQVILAYHYREPEKSKTDSDKIFGSRYEEIFNTKHEAEHLLNIHHIFQKTDKLRADANQLKKRGSVMQIDSFLTYGQFHLIYLVSLLAEKNGINISSEQNQDRLIKDAIDVMRKFVKNRKSHSFYNLFRNPKTKQDLYDLAMHKGQLEFKLEAQRSA